MTIDQRRAEAHVSRLACPRCHGALTVSAPSVDCVRDGCGFEGRLVDGVFSLGGSDEDSFFDDKFDVMLAASKTAKVRSIFYDRQSRAIEARLNPGSVVLDVGCGPAVHFARPPGAFLMGLDPSLASIRVNRDLDLRIHASAERIPIPTGTVDVIVCLYSIHHMIDADVAASRRTVRRVFAEFARVLRPGGHIFAGEVAPWKLAGIAERLVWNRARQILGNKLDMFFWPPEELDRIARQALPGCTSAHTRVPVDPLTFLAPVFALPRLQLPRFLYPFDVALYHWRSGAGTEA